MVRPVGAGFLKMLVVILSVTLGIVVVLTTGVTFFGGTKMRRLFEASTESLAGPPMPPEAPSVVTDAGADAGTGALAEPQVGDAPR